MSNGDNHGIPLDENGMPKAWDIAIPTAAQIRKLIMGFSNSKACAEDQARREQNEARIKQELLSREQRTLWQ